MSDELPDGWAVAKLADVTTRVPNVKPENEPAREFAYVDISAVDRDRNEIVVPSVRRFCGKDAPSRARRPIESGDVLFSNVRTNLRNVASVPDPAPAQLCSNGFTVLRSNGAVLPLYLLRSVLTDAFTVAVSETQTGTHYPATTDAQVFGQAIRVPPLAEQRRIVAKVEALLEQVRRAKGRLNRVPLILKRFRQAVLAAACSGQLTEAWRVANPDRLAPVRPVANRVARTRRQGANISKDGELLIDEMPDLPDSWSYWRADEVVDSDTVVTYGIVLPGPEHPGGVPYVRQQDIVDGGILVNELRHTTPAIAAKHARSTLRAGDVLLCIIRNLRVAMVPKGLDGANITQGMVRLRPGQHVRGDFLAAYLACPAAQGWMKARYFGMDMPRINVEDARAIPIALPPMDEQAEIMRRVDALFRLEEKVRGRLAASINRAGALPQAILSKAFAGELVPTEADLAQAEGRDYETALQLLQRTKTVDSNGSLPEPRKRPKRLRVNNNALRAPGAGQGRSR